MGKLRSLFVSLFLVSICMAATEPGALPGTIIQPGFDRMSAVYVNSMGDANVAALRERFGASYVSYNAQIPSEAIIVSPVYSSTSLSAINDRNIESAARSCLLSMGLSPSNCGIELSAKKFAMGKVWFVNFRKSFNGILIDDGGLNLAITSSGKVSVLWGNLDMSPVSVGNFTFLPDAAQEIASRGLEGAITEGHYLGKAILPLYFGDRVEYHPVLQYMIITNKPYAEWKVSVDAENGEILRRINQVYYETVFGHVSGMVQPLHPYDPWEEQNFHELDVNFDGYNPVTTDSVGNYTIDISDSNPINVTANLRGPYFSVMNDVGPEGQIYNTITPPDTVDMLWDDSNSLPEERDAWRSGITVHNWIDRLDPGLGVMDFPLTCNVDVDGSCNAFWASWDRSINFYAAGGGCNNMAQIADVLYHEYGHGITDLQTRPNGPNGAMHEGFSDYLACTMTNQPHVGVGFYVNPQDGYLRNIDNNKRYPNDITGEPHNDGLIISGALWNARQALSPYPMGYADSLWHFARYAEPADFEAYFWAYVAIDDNDDNLRNGTPNAWSIFHNFGDRHGIGPGTQLTITSDTLRDTEDTLQVFNLNATITSVFGLRPDSILIFYGNGADYSSAPMILVGSEWIGQIPAQHYNTHVNYYLLGVDSAGFRGTYPVGAPVNHLSFFVGPDHTPPEMELVRAPGGTINLRGPYGPFTITATDINGVNPGAVKINYHINSEIERVAYLAPDSYPNEYNLASLDLFRNLFTGDTVFYFFTALDEAHIPNGGRLPVTGYYNIAMSTSEVIEGFETYGMDRWIADDGWVLRPDGHASGHSIWYSSPNYPNNANAAITMNFDNDLSPYNHAWVTFWHKNIIYQGDSCFVDVSNNGGASWIRVGAISDTAMPGYRQAQFDISSVLRSDQSHYRIRFRFVSDASGGSVGIIIDDIGWLVAPAVDGIDESAQLPTQTELAQNYPNPFNPQTRIDFALPAGSNVRLEVFDLLGRRISTLVDGPYEPGRYSVIWNGQDASGNSVASGIYFYRLTTDSGTRQEKMTLLR
jgi:hypothetical protein